VPPPPILSLADVHQELLRLKGTRLIFHNEYDFKFALAWQLKQGDPGREIRLEKRLPGQPTNEFVDIWIGKTQQAVALELKYPKGEWDALVSGEEFSLKPGAADDQARYHFWRDIERLERWKSAGHCSRGYAILLTNVASYWEKSAGTPVDADFRTHDGRVVGPGKFDWDARASEGTKGKDARPIIIAGNYQIAWNDYSSIARHNPPAGAVKLTCPFRYIVVEVA
jgi:hypothetical protein